MKKILYIITLFFMLLILIPQSVLGGCNKTSNVHGPTTIFPADECYPTTSGGSVGTAVYSCKQDSIVGYVCYWHDYECDTPCSSNGSGGGGVGGCGAGFENVCTDSCKTENNCIGGSSNGDLCGWTSGGVPKYDCRQCSCVSTCTSTAPTIPSLISPADGTVLTNNAVNLTWSLPSSWGSACSNPLNDFKVNLWNSQTQTWTAVTLPADTTEYSFTGTNNLSYAWSVTADNGSLQTTTTTHTFTINPIQNPWWQVKNGDVTSKVPSGGYLSVAGNLSLDG